MAQRAALFIAFCLVAGQVASLSAQTAESSGQAAPLVFFNRPIVVLRARVVGRGPAERAEGARHALDDLVSRGITSPVELRTFEAGTLIVVASRGVLAITPPDVDELAGETVDGAAAEAGARMQTALNEAAEAHAPGRLIEACVVAAAVVLLALLVLWGIERARRVIAAKLVNVAEQTIARSGIADVTALRASRVLDVERWLITATAVILDALVIYATVGFVLRQFPYTRPWGESMRGFLLGTLWHLGLGVADAIPGLFTVAVIGVAARFLSRAVGVWFNAVEHGRLKPAWIYPETAQPTRRLLVILIWTFAIVVAYPYLPGSQTEAFKGVSVFFGLMVTFGSSGLVNQIMSGFMITYSRALRVGDFVSIGQVEGTVTNIGVLSTKVMTVRGEEVTIPNAVVVSQTLTNYTTNGGSAAYLPTSVTIGYDTPWRQVEALLLAAAHRTTGLRDAPPATVWRVSLDDYYVKYTLLVAPEDPRHRAEVRDRLHGHILDAFNEHGVQIMSPHYMADPAGAKVVPPSQWYAPPAAPVPAPASKVSVHW